MGINFNDLPKNLQVKLQPYMAVAGTVENAIEVAKQNGKWTEADSAKLNELNGGANWGKVMDDYSFNADKAQEYKQLADAKKNSQKTKNFKLNFGPSQAELDKKRADLQNSIVANKEKGGISGYANALVDAFKLQMTPEKEGVQQAGNTALKALGALAFAAFIVATTTSCDKIEMGQEEIQITKMIDYTSQLTALANKLTDINNNLSENGKKVAAKLEQIISTLNSIRQDNEASKNEILNAINQVKSWLELIENNQETQIQIQVDGFNSFNDFKAELLKVINGHYDDLNKQYNDLAALIAKIKNINEQIKTNTDTIIEKLDNLKDMFPELKVAIDNVASKGDIANQLLVAIYDVLQSFPNNSDMRKYMSAIINAINNNGSSIEGLRDLLKEINNSVKTGTATQIAVAKENTAAILAKLDELGFKVVDGADSIVNKIQEGNMKLDDILSVLNRIKALVNKYGDEGVTIGNEILASIGNVGDVLVDGFNAVLEAIQNNTENGKAIEALLKQVLANQETMIKNNKQGFIDVINAIKDISVSGGTPDFSKIEALLASINNGVANNGTLLKQITDQNDTVIMILKSFKQEANDKLQTIINKFGNLEEDVKAGNLLLKLINDKIDGLGHGGGSCQVDFDKLMDMLNKILKAIQDHDVHVTVDVEGKECCCCGTDKPHEGIIGDLEDLLG